MSARSTRSNQRWRGLVIAVLALLLSAALGGCREEPTIVFTSARDALAAQDVEGFLDLLTPQARDFLSRADKVSKASGRAFKILRDAKPTKRLLPAGDVTDVVEDGRRCVLVIKKGRNKNQVPMRLVRGQWRIDLLEMDSFMEAIKPRN